MNFLLWDAESGALLCHFSMELLDMFLSPMLLMVAAAPPEGSTLVKSGACAPAGASDGFLWSALENGNGVWRALVLAFGSTGAGASSSHSNSSSLAFVFLNFRFFDPSETGVGAAAMTSV